MVSISATNLSLLLILLAVPFVGGDFLAWQVGLFLIYGLASQGVGVAWGQAGFCRWAMRCFLALEVMELQSPFKTLAV